jgi:hypothetical protein
MQCAVAQVSGRERRNFLTHPEQHSKVQLEHLMASPRTEEAQIEQSALGGALALVTVGRGEETLMVEGREREEGLRL